MNRVSDCRYQRGLHIPTRVHASKLLISDDDDLRLASHLLLGLQHVDLVVIEEAVASFVPLLQEGIRSALPADISLAGRPLKTALGACEA